MFSRRFLYRFGSGLLGNVSAQSLALLVQLVVALVSVPIFATVWGLERYGVWLILFTLPAYLALIDLGFVGAAGNAMTAQVSCGKRAAAVSLFRALSAASFWSGAILLGVLATLFLSAELGWLAFADKATTGRTPETIFALAAYAIFALWARTLYTALRATGHFAKGAYAIALAALLDIALAAGIALANGGLLGAAVGYAIGQACGLAAMTMLVARHAPDFRPCFLSANLDVLRPLVRAALALVMVAIGQALLLQGTVVVLGLAAGAAAVPSFVALRTLARLGIQAVAVVNQAVMPELTMARARPDAERVRNLVAINLAAAAAIALPASIALTALGPIIVRFWSGSVISAGPALSGIMALVLLFGCFWGPLASFLTAENLQARYALPFVVVAAAATLLAYPLSQAFGASGAALAMLLVDIAMLIWTARAVWQAHFLKGLPISDIPRRAFVFLSSRVLFR